MNADKLEELNAIIYDLLEFDNNHLLLDPEEVVVNRLSKTGGNMGFYMLSPENINGKGTTLIEFSNIQPYLMQLYVDLVLLNGHVRGESIKRLDEALIKISSLEDSFGISILILINNIIGALITSIAKDDKVLFSGASGLLYSFIVAILDMYDVPNNDFYSDVENYVYEELAAKSKNSRSRTSKRFKIEFKGSRTVNIEAKIDRRKSIPFSGFKLTIDARSTIFFSGDNVANTFLNMSKFIWVETAFKDVKIILNSQTNALVDEMDIMFIKEEVMQDNMSEGFYPILVPKGVNNVDDFLDSLIK